MKDLKVPRYDRKQKASTYKGQDLSELEDHLVLAAETIASRANRQLSSVPSVARPIYTQSIWSVINTALWNVMHTVLPPLEPRFFYGSSLVGLSLVFLSPTLSVAAGDFLRARVPAFFTPSWWQGSYVAWLVDPAVQHLVLGGVIWLIWFWILTKRRRELWTAPFIFPLLLAGVLAGSYILINEFWKPALGIPRLPSYNPEFEPPLARFLISTWGGGEGTPSGFSARQSLLLLVLFWSMYHPAISAYLRWSSRALLLLLGFITVFVVGSERVLVGAHTFSDAIVGAGIAVACFWTMVLPVYVYLVPAARGSTERRMLGDLAMFWVLLGLALSLYTNNVLEVVRLSIILAGAITALRFLIPRLNPWYLEAQTFSSARSGHRRVAAHLAGRMLRMTAPRGSRRR